MQITDHTLTINSVSIDLPKLAVDATVHVWTVPVAYQSNGYFVSVQVPGQPMEIPACDGREIAYLGSLPLEADAGAELAQAQKDAISAAASALDAALAPYAARFGVLERETWGAQLAEAKAIMADPTLTADQYPAIAGIIAVTGETAGDFAAAVIKNNEDWLRIAANAAGQRQKIVAQIKTCTTVAEVEAVSTAITVG